MGKLIVDEFQNVRSRVRRYQLRRRKNNLCIICGQGPAITSCYCKSHADQHNLRRRLKRLLKAA